MLACSTHGVKVSILDIKEPGGRTMFQMLCQHPDGATTTLLKLLLQHEKGQYLRHADRSGCCHAAIIGAPELLSPDHIAQIFGIIPLISMLPMRVAFCKSGRLSDMHFLHKSHDAASHR